MLHVCSLAALPDTVRATGASHVLTVMANVEQVARPVSVLPANHLKISMDDITEQMGDAQQANDYYTTEIDLSWLEEPYPLAVRRSLLVSGDRDLLVEDVPVLAQRFAKKMLDEGIYVIGFFYPVVPEGKARIRVQVSAAHTHEHLQKAVAAFIKVGRELNVLT